MSEIIVSFTSYPKRILTIDKVLDSIVNQTILPNKIVLYLSSDEFEGFKDMPDLKRYEKYGFEIHWYKENLRSHKKWFYAFQEYPEDIVITVDDDILYAATAFENLLKYHTLFPEAVIARRTHLITWKSENDIAPYQMWYSECFKYVGLPRADLFATGCGGILYPPNIFNKEIFNKDVFMKICAYADDVWLKAMEVYSRIPVVLAERSWDDHVLPEYQKNSLYSNYNRNGGNDVQIKAIFDQYMHIYDQQNLETGTFVKEKKMYSEINDLKIAERKRVLNELLLKLEMNDKILIYGAGTVGKQFYKWLRCNRVPEIEAFVVSDMANNTDYIDAVPVKIYTEYIRGFEKLVVAIWETNDSYEVCKRLLESGVDRRRIIVLNRLEKQSLMEI